MLSIIDGEMLGKMIVSAANNLENNKKTVDSLNVFPVPDGDTGTNMSLTIMSAAKEFKDKKYESAGEAAEVVALSTLRGARGNSGVILSQIFRGFSKAIKGQEKIDARDFARGLKLASDTAYRAVMKPTEGTILTVIRLCAERAQKETEKNGDISALLEEVIKTGNEVLMQTPQMLPALKKAGVVDAGGKGLMFILEGMLYVLKNGAVVELEGGAPSEAAVSADIDTGEITFGYCTEFIINKENFGVDTEKFKERIRKKGDSCIVIDELDMVKVHIHTNNPGFVIEEALKLGELVNIKIDNMRRQHREVQKSAEPSKKYGFAAVGTGEGIKLLFKDLNVDSIIDGGQTMNPSTEDVLGAINSINAENIFVLPNNKNIILSAEQAKDLTDKKVFVLHTRSIPQGIGALLAFDMSLEPEENLKEMERAAEQVKSGLVTYSVRDTADISQGDILGIYNDEIVVNGKNVDDATKALVEKMVDENTQVITIIYGRDTKEEDAKNLGEFFEKKYPGCDIILHDGGQPIYYYIISVE